MTEKIRWICRNAIGTVLFVTLSLCLRVPVYSNFYICLGYVVMTVYMYLFGPVSGTIVGVLGTGIYCILINGLRGMPGWLLANVVIGIVVGITLQICNAKVFKRTLVKWCIVIPSTIVAVALGIFGAKSLTESILYAQPMLVRMATNAPAFITDVIVILLSIPLCEMLRRNKEIKNFVK